ncbi:hypothetical protein BN1723_001998 [Verticillium longisporum]|uniref:Zn(2)-C6 fungal-type domain-containing protein n=1 Tax=Verticillium longisporum TaxID=100787 RepID=A0A0G4KVB4_VERLO|nr:hypothetical protein BN1723_001998 [Verticillium longisporum]
MVYCGKASQGCEHCRVRRIKCNKAKPECSQCVRAGKKCPGYRDQLSLMFRDESTKVIQKAHAQWGHDSASDTASTVAVSTAAVARRPSNSTSISSASPPVQPPRPLSVSAVASSSPSTHPEPPKPDPQWSTPSPFQSGGLQRSPSIGMPSAANAVVVVKEEPAEPALSSLLIGPSLEERGIQFYVDRYLLGHPDEPKTIGELGSSAWLWNPALQHVMAAVGLAGLSNLTGNAEMMAAARQKYGQALRQTGQLIQPPNAPSLEVTIRSVVMLAMFEVVKGTHHATGTVHAHVMGGAALMRSWCPLPNAPFGGFRALMQLCYSMLLSLDTELGTWADSLEGQWLYRTEKAPDLPPRAVFRGEYHLYFGVWFARIWNYYRWARILVDQNLLDLINQNPISSLPLVSVARRAQVLDTIRSLARDVLVSTPSHWRHPLLDDAAQITVESAGGGGSGAAGLPALLFQLKVASCAPGVPKSFWAWALDIIQTIWGDMGMLHARSMMEAMRAHQDALHRTGVEGILSDEW